MSSKKGRLKPIVLVFSILVMHIGFFLRLLSPGSEMAYTYSLIRDAYTRRASSF